MIRAQRAEKRNGIRGEQNLGGFLGGESPRLDLLKSQFDSFAIHHSVAPRCESRRLAT